jgi:glycosyltransferase involved in cell wall biosynthesis
LLPTLEIGGKERSVVDLCAAFPDLGVEPLIVTYDRAPPGAATLDPGAAPHVALDRTAPDFAARLRETIAEAGVDLLHAHGHVAAVYAAHSGIPTLCTIHAALGRGWRWLPTIWRALRHMDRLAAVSDDLAAAARRLTRRDVATIPIGVDLTRFAPAPPRIAGNEFVVGIAARLHPVKRHRDLFAAMSLLAESGVRARLLVAGDGPLADRLRTAAPPNVEMLGAVADMPAFYRRLDGFILCSDHEGMPVALLEAMASGLPCVATRVGGMAALTGAGRGVIGVPRRHPAAIAAALAGLANDPSRRRLLGQQARAAVRPWSLERQANAYAALYREISRSARPR